MRWTWQKITQWCLTPLCVTFLCVTLICLAFHICYLWNHETVVLYSVCGIDMPCGFLLWQPPWWPLSPLSPHTFIANEGWGDGIFQCNEELEPRPFTLSSMFYVSLWIHFGGRQNKDGRIFVLGQQSRSSMCVCLCLSLCSCRFQRRKTKQGNIGIVCVTRHVGYAGQAAICRTPPSPVPANMPSASKHTKQHLMV